ncbi:MAG: hypothetical protein N2447_03625 [Thermoanaerobaculum sp.]|nr:hypothetical protein [Thermoanaerobaculum sp.]
MSSLFWLAGRGRELEARAWVRTMEQLRAQARALGPSALARMEAALRCAELRHEAGLLSTQTRGLWLREARLILADGRLTEDELNRLLVVGQQVCPHPAP